MLLSANRRFDDGECQSEGALRSGGNMWNSPVYEDEGENARHKVE
jgi:hypothetical protein